MEASCFCEKKRRELSHHKAGREPTRLIKGGGEAFKPTDWFTEWSEEMVRKDVRKTEPEINRCVANEQEKARSDT